MERQAQLMQDISDKDSTIFALNKQLTSLKNLLQSQELMIGNTSMMHINDTASMMN